MVNRLFDEIQCVGAPKRRALKKFETLHNKGPDIILVYDNGD